MINQKKYIKFAELIIRNNKGIADKKVKELLRLKDAELNSLISFFQSEQLIKRFSNEEFPSSLKPFPRGVIAVAVKPNCSKPTGELGVWIKKENEEYRENNRKKITLILALFLGLFNFLKLLFPLGLLFIPSWVVSAVGSFLVCLFVYYFWI